jgi:hypothetical protein
MTSNPPSPRSLIKLLGHSRWPILRCQRRCQPGVGSSRLLSVRWVGAYSGDGPRRAQSGHVRFPGNAVYRVKRYRGFESLSLRIPFRDRCSYRLQVPVPAQRCAIGKVLGALLARAPGGTSNRQMASTRIRGCCRPVYPCGSRSIAKLCHSCSRSFARVWCREHEASLDPECDAAPQDDLWIDPVCECRPPESWAGAQGRGGPRSRRSSSRDR